MNGNLLSILQGCLNPNTVQHSEKQLVEYSFQSNFLADLLQLLPDQTFQISTMIMSTLKNYTAQKYNHPHNPIPPSQKDMLRSNIFNLFYIINGNNQAMNLYKQIVHMIIAVDFQRYQQLFYELLNEDLNGGISASVYFSRQVARFYEWLAIKERAPLQRFIYTYFTKIQQLAQKILTDYNTQTRKLLQQILEMFYSAFHIQVPEYLRQFQNIKKWILYLSTILKAPMQDFSQNHILVSRIYVKLFTMYCRDGTDGKSHRGWSAQFRQHYVLELYNQIISILVNPLPNQDIMTNILSCLSAVTNNPELRTLLQQSHCQAIIYNHLIPYMQSTPEDYSYFKSDGLEYIRRSEDLTCHPYRRGALDLIKSIMDKLCFGNKSQLIKFIEYTAEVLGSSSSTDKQKQVILIVLAQLCSLIMKNRYLKDNFENLLQQYFIPLIKNGNLIIVAQVLNMLTVYLKMSNLSTGTVTDLIGLIYDRMCQDNIVVKYYAVRAFTELLDDKQALEATRPHFQNILEIYVKLLQVLDHQGLISSLKSIVKVFSKQIIPMANDLANHLFNLFYSMHSKQEQQNQDNQQNQSKQAAAALSTIKQILQSDLLPDTYFLISQKVMILLQNLCSQYDDYFQEILNILNTLVFKANNIVSFQLPYLLSRKLLQGNNSILGTCQNDHFVHIVAEAEKADSEYSESLISILKNLIQKMPQNILHQYELPTNPQLLLCLIENKKIPFQALPQLNLSELDTQWSLILQSYTSVVYNLGQVCSCTQLKMLNGVSLYPWIQFKLDSEVIKKILVFLQDEQADDEYYEQNTAQMLQKFAAQDQDEGDYYISSGGNYSYMYNSPYNPQQDKQHLLTKIKQLNSNLIQNLITQLSQKHRNKLESLFNEQ